MKKHSLTFYAVVVLSVLSVVFLVAAIVTSALNVRDAENAIAGLGEITYTDEVRAKIDNANQKYEILDRNLGLQNLVENRKVLSDAKLEYARLAIREVYLASQNEESSETVLALIADAQDILKSYFTEDEYSQISNYGDLTEAIEKYGSGVEETAPPADDATDEDIELC